MVNETLISKWSQLQTLGFFSLKVPKCPNKHFSSIKKKIYF